MFAATLKGAQLPIEAFIWWPLPKMSPSWTIFPLNKFPVRDFGREKTHCAFFHWEFPGMNMAQNKNSMFFFWSLKHQQPYTEATAIQISTIHRLMRSRWGGRTCQIDPPGKVGGCHQSMCQPLRVAVGQTRKAIGRKKLPHVSCFETTRFIARPLHNSVSKTEMAVSYQIDPEIENPHFDQLL